MTANRSFPRWMLLGCALFSSCAVYSTRITAIDKNKIAASEKVAFPTKVHLHDGSIILCDKGFKVTGKVLISCPGGVKYDSTGTVVSETDKIIIDSIAAMGYHEVLFSEGEYSEPAPGLNKPLTPSGETVMLVTKGNCENSRYALVVAAQLIPPFAPLAILLAPVSVPLVLAARKHSADVCLPAVELISVSERALVVYGGPEAKLYELPLADIAWVDDPPGSTYRIGQFSEKDLVKLRQYARHPQGLSPVLRKQLLQRYKQDDFLRVPQRAAPQEEPK